MICLRWGETSSQMRFTVLTWLKAALWSGDENDEDKANSKADKAEFFSLLSKEPRAVQLWNWMNAFQVEPVKDTDGWDWKNGRSSELAGNKSFQFEPLLRLGWKMTHRLELIAEHLLTCSHERIQFSLRFNVSDFWSSQVLKWGNNTCHTLSHYLWNKNWDRTLKQCVRN